MIGTMAASADHPGPADRLVRTETWAGVHAGEPVGVSGVRVRGAQWTFLAHVRNRVTGAEWIEVVGGRGGDRTLRSFRPEQVFPATGPGAGRSGRSPGSGRRARSAASLAEAPRLPLAPAPRSDR